jgi:hypothetical protein
MKRAVVYWCWSAWDTHLLKNQAVGSGSAMEDGIEDAENQAPDGKNDE